MKRIQVGGCLALSAVLAAGCATMSVNSFVRRGVDVSSYHTWGWGTPDALPTGDPRLDNNEMFHDRMQQNIAAQMARSGYEQAPDWAAADLLVHYHASISQRLLVSSVDGQFQTGCEGGGCGQGPAYFEQGTLILDFVDARAGRLVWRGWAQDAFEGVVDDQDRLDRKVDEAIDRIMRRFPPAAEARGPRAIARLVTPPVPE
jgi:hypothetical protein